MVKISKKIALTLLCGAFFANSSADSFLSKFIEKHPYAAALGCAVMSGFSFFIGDSALYNITWQDEFMNRGQIKDEIERRNYVELSKIFEHHKLFPATITTENFDQTEKERAYIAAIRYGINLTRKDYCIQKSKIYQHSFPDDQRFVKYIIHEHDVRYWELPPVWKKKVEKDKEVLILKPTKRYELEIKKQNRWIPGFCFGVSALNFATAVGLAAYGYTKKA